MRKPTAYPLEIRGGSGTWHESRWPPVPDMAWEVALLAFCCFLLWKRSWSRENHRHHQINIHSKQHFEYVQPGRYNSSLLYSTALFESNL